MTTPFGALRIFGVVALFFLASQAFIPVQAATTYTMTLQTDIPSYSGAQPITITGVISPAPGPNTGVIITVKNPVGTVADVNEVFPGPTNGSFSDVSYPGGNAAWTSGTFTVNATWGGSGGTASKIATFVYSPTAVTTSTTVTTTTSSTTTTTTTSTTSTTTTSSSRTTTSANAPEFPTSVLAIVALAAMAMVAALSKRIGAHPVQRSSS
jgi:hypothetical protein